MAKIELSKDEESLLTFLSKKKGPVYVMEQDMPALNSLHIKGFVATSGNVGVITEEGKAWLGPDETVLKFLKEWEKKVRDPHAERLHEDLGEHADVDPLVLAIRKKIRELGIDPNKVYPVDISTSQGLITPDHLPVTIIFDLGDRITVKLDDVFDGNEERHKEWLGLVGVKPENKEPGSG